MEVADCVLLGDVLVIATSITLWVGAVDLRDGMERLMDVSNVVDDQTEGEGFLILSVAEVVSNLLDVVAVILCDSALEEANQVSQGIDHVILRWSEVIVIEGATLVKVWLVYEMPVCLP